MSQENVEVARRLWKQLRQAAAMAQPAVLPEFGWDPEVEYVEDPRWPGAGVYRGAEAIQARFAEYLDVLGSTDMTVAQLVEAGDTVISIFRTGGESAQTGLPFEHEWAYVWTFRHGRVVEWRAYFDKTEALEAVGLSESAMSQEPVNMVDRLLNDCWMSADLDLVPEILDPEVVWTAIESAPDAGTRRGHAEARAYMDDWIEGFDLHPMVIEQAGTGGDGRLVCSLHGAATEKRTGLTSEIHFAGVFDFASDGRLVEIHEYATLEEALRAVGLSE